MRKQIHILGDFWFYEIFGSHTNILDPHYNVVMQPKGRLTIKEVRAAIDGYAVGFRDGKKKGEYSKIAEIKRVLNIPLLSNDGEPR
jgi:hypothetical protein